MANVLKNTAAMEVIAKMYLNEELADVHFVFKIDDDVEKIPANKGEVTLTIENIETVVRLADKYDVLEYVNVCAEFLKSELPIDNMCWGYQLAVNLKIEYLIEFYESKIMQWPKEVFATDAFHRCDKSILKRILELDLTCNEAEVFDACLIWAKNACKQEGLDESQSMNLRIKLSDCLKLIRFGLMKVNEFNQRYVLYKGLFTMEEFEDIMLSMTLNEYEPKIFNKKPRLEWDMGKILQCERKTGNRDPLKYIQSTEVIVATEREADLVHQTEEVLSSVSAEWKAQCDQLAAVNAELQATNDILNQDLIKHQVDISTLGSQLTSLNTQHVALQLANSQLASEKDALVKQKKNIESQHNSLLADQKQMQTLHEQLSIEYEALYSEHKKLKESLRDVRHDNQNFHDQEQNFKQQITDLQAKLLKMKKENEAYSNLRSEHSKLKDDFSSLFTINDRVKNEYKSIQEQYKILRTENAKLNLQNTELNGELGVRIDQVKALEIELTKELNRCEILVQTNANLDIDRRALMDHVSQLLAQYHELLGHSLDDQQHHHDEEKLFTDKANNLHRQKEKLEEQIMEFYRKIDSNQKKKPFGRGVLTRVKVAGTDLVRFQN